MRVHADRLKATGSKVIPEDCSRSNDLDYSVFVQCALDVNDRSVGRCVQFPRKLINIEVFQRKRLERNLLAGVQVDFCLPCNLDARNQNSAYVHRFKFYLYADRLQFIIRIFACGIFVIIPINRIRQDKQGLAATFHLVAQSRDILFSLALRFIDGDVRRGQERAEADATVAHLCAGDYSIGIRFQAGLADAVAVERAAVEHRSTPRGRIRSVHKPLCKCCRTNVSLAQRTFVVKLNNSLRDFDHNGNSCTAQVIRLIRCAIAVCDLLFIAIHRFRLQGFADGTAEACAVFDAPRLINALQVTGNRLDCKDVVLVISSVGAVVVIRFKEEIVVHTILALPQVERSRIRFRKGGDVPVPILGCNLIKDGLIVHRYRAVYGIPSASVLRHKQIKAVAPDKCSKHAGCKIKRHTIFMEGNNRSADAVKRRIKGAAFGGNHPAGISCGIQIKLRAVGQCVYLIAVALPADEIALQLRRRKRERAKV